MATVRWKVTELINGKTAQTDNQIAVRKIKNIECPVVYTAAHSGYMVLT